MLTGYTTLMSPESMGLSYLECLASWAQVCDKIAICYSKFPKLNLKVPEGAVCPWEDDGSLEILDKFDKDVLGNKLVLIEHKWNPDNPREDGLTKQTARELALKQFPKNDNTGWTIQFDADEILRDQDIPRVLSFVQEQAKNPTHVYACAGILEMFGGLDKVRFGFGNWVKIRMTRNTQDIIHDMVLHARGRNPRTGQIIAVDNKDDGAGITWKYNLVRPDYNQGAWLFNPQIIQMGWQLAQKNNIPTFQLQNVLEDSLNTGMWIFHTSWIDIARKWRMGWFFDNFWSVLNGKQDTFTEKADITGHFTHTRQPENLQEELARELNRPTIVEIKNNQYPLMFGVVKDWREKSGYNAK